MAAAARPRRQLLTREAVGRLADPATLLPAVDVLDRIRLVVRALGDEPGLTSRELAERAGINRRHMSLLLLRLEEHGHVAHEGRRWFPAHDGLI